MMFGTIVSHARNLYLAVLFLLALSACYGHPSQDQAEESQPKKHYRYQRTIKEYYENGKPTGIKVEIGVTEFDTNRNIVFEKSEDGSTEYKFNNKGKMIELISREVDGTISWHRSTDWDDQNHVATISFYDGDGELDRKVVEQYDTLDHLMESKDYDVDFGLTVLMVFTYDEKGRKTSYSTVDSSRNINSMMVGTYPNDTTEVWKSRTTAKNRQHTMTIIKNAAGKELEVSHLWASGTFTKQTWKYDTDGWLIESIEYGDKNQPTSRLTYEHFN